MHKEEILFMSQLFLIFDNCAELIDSLIAKIFAFRTPFTEENFLRLSLILFKSLKEIISEYLPLVLLRNISMKFNLGIIF